MKNRPFLSRLGFALSGLGTALKAERSFRAQAVVALAALAALVALRPAPVWWALVALVAALVLAAELVNTAVEHLADHLHAERHPTIKLVKDCLAAAVLVASLGALAVAGALIYDLLR
jgi:undecaprenol kinase